MVQVDVFWSYGIGSGLALAAGHQLRRRAERRRTGAKAEAGPGIDATKEATAEDATGASGGWLSDPYLLATVLYLAVIFAPSGAWLLWGFPSWETMHAGDRSLPAWLVALFAATNVTQGVLGFIVAGRLLVRGRTRLAFLQVLAGYFGMFFILVHGWDGTGYRRFFSATRADLEQWGSGAALGHVGDWLTSDVALTLYGMGAVLIPVMLAIMSRWHAEGARLADPGSAGAVPAGLKAMVGLTLSIVALSLGGAIIASLLVHALGWVLGVAAFAVLAWATVVRRGAAVSRLVTGLGLPREMDLRRTAADSAAA